MVEQQQPAARPQHPDHLGDRPLVVRDGAQRQGADDGVEGGPGERQGLRVAFAEGHSAAEVVGPAAGLRQPSMAGLHSSPVSRTSAG